MKPPPIKTTPKTIKANHALPKSAIRGLVSYRPDVKPTQAGRQIRLSVNEGALGASPKAIAAIKSLGESLGGEALHRYPPQISQDLTAAIAARFGVNAAHILPANGSDELIGLLCTAYLEAGDEAIITQYGFLVFPQAIRIAGGVPVVASDAGLTVSIDAIINAITPKTKLIFLANPNNPTGTMVSCSEIERLIEEVPRNVLIVLDSAYAEYVTEADYTDGADYVEQHDNVVMLRTFSKIFGLASLRLGWGYLPLHVLEVLASIRGPFSVNAAAALAGASAVQDMEFFNRSLAHNNEWRPRMQDSIAQAGFQALPSVANFFLIQFADAEQARDAHAFLASDGIHLRKMVPYGLPEFLRMSLGTPDEMEAVADAFKNLAAQLNKDKA